MKKKILLETLVFVISIMLFYYIGNISLLKSIFIALGLTVINLWILIKHGNLK